MIRAAPGQAQKNSIQPNFIAPDADSDRPQAGSFAWALQAATAVEIKGCTVMGTHQQPVIPDEKPVRCKVQAAALVRAGIVVCHQAAPAAENHQEERAIFAVDTKFPAFFIDFAGCANSV